MRNPPRFAATIASSDTTITAVALKTLAFAWSPTRGIGAVVVHERSGARSGDAHVLDDLGSKDPVEITEGSDTGQYLLNFHPTPM